MLGFLKRFDAVLAPVCAFPAVLHGTSFDPDKAPGFAYTMTYNLTGWPSTTVRAGTSPEGLPIGVQIAARPWREDVSLALARQLEAEFGGFKPPPGF
jgi:amidase